MRASSVPRDTDPSIMYAVMTPAPLHTEDLIPAPSAELLRHYGTSDIALRRLRSRRHQVLIMRQAPLVDVAAVSRDTRIEALLLAEEHDGVVIDLAIPRVVEQRSDEVSLAHATQWYVVDYAELEDGILRTVGLSAFGLPEVAMLDVSREGHAMFSAVLAGLVHRIIAEWPINDPVGPATVTLRDIAYGLGDVQAEATPNDRAIDVEVAYEANENKLEVEILSDPADSLFAV